MDRDVFCKVPWVSAFVSPDGEIRACCQNFDVRARSKILSEAVNEPAFRQLRQEFLDGKRPESCKRCYAKEKMAHTSYRTRFHDYLKKAGQDEKIDVSSNSYDKTLRIDVSVSNTCNLTCRTCSPYASSKWIQKVEVAKSQLPTLPAFTSVSEKQMAKADIEDIARFVNHSHDHLRIYLQGGEPFIDSSTRDLMKLLIENGVAPKTELVFISNGSHLREDILSLLPRFKKTMVNVSVDGHAPVQSYIRGVALDKVETAIRRLQDLNVFAGISFTLCAYNVLWLSEFNQWFDQFFAQDSCLLTISPLVFPAPLSIGAVSSTTIKESIEKLNSSNGSHKAEFTLYLERELKARMQEPDPAKFENYDKSLSQILNASTATTSDAHPS